MNISTGLFISIFLFGFTVGFAISHLNVDMLNQGTDSYDEQTIATCRESYKGFIGEPK